MTIYGLKLNIMDGPNYGWFKELSCTIYILWNDFFLLALSPFNCDITLDQAPRGKLGFANSVVIPHRKILNLISHRVPHTMFS